MTEIVSGEKSDINYPILIPCVIFIIVRNDINIFKANKDACPSFSKYLQEANDMGVQITALSIEIQYDEKTKNLSCFYKNKIAISYD